MPEHLFFLLGLALLLTHELDAIRHKEWRLFIGLRSLEEEQAFRSFTALHVPLFFLILWGAFGSGEQVRHTVILGLNLFFMVHVVLHMLFRRHPHYGFHSGFSWSLIAGAGVCGLLDLTISC